VGIRLAISDRIPSAVIAALWVFLSALCAATAEATELFNLPDFAFEDGSVLPDLRIAYDTHGTLSPARDNAILLMPGATGDRHAFDPLIGPAGCSIPTAISSSPSTRSGAASPPRRRMGWGRIFHAIRSAT